MKQRLGDRLDDRLVGLGRGAFDHQPRRLAERSGHFPDEAGEALEGVMQGQHPQAEHRALQLADQAIEQQVLVLQRDRERLADRRRPARARPNGRWRSWRSAARRSVERGRRSDRHRHAAWPPAPAGPACRAGSGGRSARPSRIRSMAVDHGLGIAGDQAALQQAFEIRRVQRPAMMAQHVGRDAACRIRAGRRRLPPPARQAAASAPREGRGRWPTGRSLSAGRVVASAGPRAARAAVSGAASVGEAADEVVGLGIGIGRNLAGRPASGRSRR